MADALDDGLILDDTLVSYSDENDERKENEQILSKSSSKKEKTSGAMDAKKQKRKAARQRVSQTMLTQKAAAYREEVHAAQAVALQPSERQADFVAAQQRKTFPKLSSLELQEIAVPFALPKEDDLSSARSNAPWNKEKGTPRVLMVAGNAQRAADLARELRCLLDTSEQPPAKRRKGAESSTSGGVAKLFARHFKVSEQVSHLQEQTAPLAVGTPHRIAQLIDTGALRTDQLAALVIDHTWTDAKLRTIFDTPETRQALIHLLCNVKLREAYKREESRCRSRDLMTTSGSSRGAKAPFEYTLASPAISWIVARKDKQSVEKQPVESEPVVSKPTDKDQERPLPQLPRDISRDNLAEIAEQPGPLNIQSGSATVDESNADQQASRLTTTTTTPAAQQTSVNASKRPIGSFEVPQLEPVTLYGYTAVAWEHPMDIEEAYPVVVRILDEIRARGVASPQLLSSMAGSLSASRSTKLIKALLATYSTSEEADPQAAETFAEELRSSNVYNLVALLKWVLARIGCVVAERPAPEDATTKTPLTDLVLIQDHGFLSWSAYATWREREKQEGYPNTAYVLLTQALEPPVVRLLDTLLDFFALVATHSRHNGMTPSKIGRLFGPLLFGLPEDATFSETYTQFVRAGNAVEHILLAFMRYHASMARSQDMLPKRLLKHIRDYPRLLASDVENSSAFVSTLPTTPITRTVREYARDLVHDVVQWPSQALISALDGGVSDAPIDLAEQSRKLLNIGATRRSKRQNNAAAAAPTDASSTLASQRWADSADDRFDDMDRTRLSFDLREQDRKPGMSRIESTRWYQFEENGFPNPKTEDSRLDWVIRFDEELQDEAKREPHVVTMQTPSLPRNNPHNFHGQNLDFPYDTRCVAGAPIAVDELFPEVWADYLIGNGWSNRDEGVHRRANFAILQLSRMTGANADDSLANISASGADVAGKDTSSNTPNQMNATGAWFVVEEVVPESYRLTLDQYGRTFRHSLPMLRKLNQFRMVRAGLAPSSTVAVVHRPPQSSNQPVFGASPATPFADTQRTPRPDDGVLNTSTQPTTSGAAQRFSAGSLNAFGLAPAIDSSKDASANLPVDSVQRNASQMSSTSQRSTAAPVSQVSVLNRNDSALLRPASRMSTEPGQDPNASVPISTERQQSAKPSDASALPVDTSLNKAQPPLPAGRHSTEYAPMSRLSMDAYPSARHSTDGRVSNTNSNSDRVNLSSYASPASSAAQNQEVEQDLVGSYPAKSGVTPEIIEEEPEAPQAQTQALGLDIQQDYTQTQRDTHAEVAPNVTDVRAPTRSANRRNAPISPSAIVVPKPLDDASKEVGGRTSTNQTRKLPQDTTKPSSDARIDPRQQRSPVIGLWEAQPEPNRVQQAVNERGPGSISPDSSRYREHLPSSSPPTASQRPGSRMRNMVSSLGGAARKTSGGAQRDETATNANQEPRSKGSKRSLRNLFTSPFQVQRRPSAADSAQSRPWSPITHSMPSTFNRSERETSGGAPRSGKSSNATTPRMRDGSGSAYTPGSQHSAEYPSNNYGRTSAAGVRVPSDQAPTSPRSSKGFLGNLRNRGSSWLLKPNQQPKPMSATRSPRSPASDLDEDDLPPPPPRLQQGSRVTLVGRTGSYGGESPNTSGAMLSPTLSPNTRLTETGEMVAVSPEAPQPNLLFSQPAATAENAEHDPQSASEKNIPATSASIMPEAQSNPSSGRPVSALGSRRLTRVPPPRVPETDSRATTPSHNMESQRDTSVTAPSQNLEPRRDTSARASSPPALRTADRLGIWSANDDASSNLASIDQNTASWSTTTPNIDADNRRATVYMDSYTSPVVYDSYEHQTPSVQDSHEHQTPAVYDTRAPEAPAVQDAGVNAVPLDDSRASGSELEYASVLFPHQITSDPFARSDDSRAASLSLPKGTAALPFMGAPVRSAAASNDKTRISQVAKSSPTDKINSPALSDATVMPNPHRASYTAANTLNMDLPSNQGSEAKVASASNPSESIKPRSTIPSAAMPPSAFATTPVSRPMSGSATPSQAAEGIPRRPSQSGVSTIRIPSARMTGLAPALSSLSGTTTSSLPWSQQSITTARTMPRAGSRTDSYVPTIIPEESFERERERDRNKEIGSSERSELGTTSMMVNPSSSDPNDVSLYVEATTTASMEPMETMRNYIDRDNATTSRPSTDLGAGDARWSDAISSPLADAKGVAAPTLTDFQGLDPDEEAFFRAGLALETIPYSSDTLSREPVASTVSTDPLPSAKQVSAEKQDGNLNDNTDANALSKQPITETPPANTHEIVPGPVTSPSFPGVDRPLAGFAKSTSSTSLAGSARHSRQSSRSSARDALPSSTSQTSQVSNQSRSSSRANPFAQAADGRPNEWADTTVRANPTAGNPWPTMGTSDSFRGLLAGFKQPALPKSASQATSVGAMEISPLDVVMQPEGAVHEPKSWEKSTEAASSTPKRAAQDVEAEQKSEEVQPQPIDQSASGDAPQEVSANTETDKPSSDLKSGKEAAPSNTTPSTLPKPATHKRVPSATVEDVPEEVEDVPGTFPA
ncbi:hypothetical protein MPSI1_001720 [Malassezia psittaci]|uniref:Rho-GAP domain-containing protein n=1 Tax=Malassezia psittaci TaxID=1821823 RepID=A0AAF0F5B0_9BASI|nr:hypothetical protein MPSI1_001720 [Malassezia psittaci]